MIAVEARTSTDPGEGRLTGRVYQRGSVRWLEYRGDRGERAAAGAGNPRD
jgi:hypothetical protein